MAAAFAHFAQTVQHLRQHLPQHDHVLRALTAAHGKHLLLGDLQNLRRLADALLHQRGDLTGSLCHAPQQRLIPHDGHIFHHVGAGGGDLHQLGQIGASRVFVIGARLLHLLTDGNAVDGLCIGEHGVDRFKDLPVLPQIKVRRAQFIHHVLDAIGIDEHGAEHGLLTF